MKKKVKEILGTSLYLLGVLVATFLIVTYVGQRTKVSGSSMEPMLSDGDNLIIDKISYRFQDPQRFDIVVFPFQYANRPYYIKRIIGLPGETIYIDDDGNIYINNEILKEPYGKEVITDPGGHMSLLPWEKMNILSWATTGIIVPTAGIRWSVMFIGMI